MCRWLIAAALRCDRAGRSHAGVNNVLDRMELAIARERVPPPSSSVPSPPPSVIANRRDILDGKCGAAIALRRRHDVAERRLHCIRCCRRRRTMPPSRKEGRSHAMRRSCHLSVLSAAPARSPVPMMRLDADVTCSLIHRVPYRWRRRRQWRQPDRGDCFLPPLCLLVCRRALHLVEECR